MKLLAAVLTMLLFVGFWALQPASAQTKTMEVSLGTATVLTDDKGMTLYIFLRDAPAKSNCNDRCAEFRPPLMADAAASAAEKFSIITRDDGSKQWAYKERPLYRFARDEKMRRVRVSSTLGWLPAPRVGTTTHPNEPMSAWRHRRFTLRRVE